MHVNHFIIVLKLGTKPVCACTTVDNGASVDKHATEENFLYSFLTGTIKIVCDFMLFSLINTYMYIYPIFVCIYHTLAWVSFNITHIYTTDFIKGPIFCKWGFFPEISHSNVFTSKLVCVRLLSTGLLKFCKTRIFSKNKYTLEKIYHS